MNKLGVAHSSDINTVVDSLKTGWNTWSRGRETSIQSSSNNNNQGEGDWKSSVGGALSLLWDSGI